MLYFEQLTCYILVNCCLLLQGHFLLHMGRDLLYYFLRLLHLPLRVIYSCILTQTLAALLLCCYSFWANICCILSQFVAAYCCKVLLHSYNTIESISFIFWANWLLYFLSNTCCTSDILEWLLHCRHIEVIKMLHFGYNWLLHFKADKSSAIRWPDIA